MNKKRGRGGESISDSSINRVKVAVEVEVDAKANALGTLPGNAAASRLDDAAALTGSPSEPEDEDAGEGDLWETDSLLEDALEELTREEMDGGGADGSNSGSGSSNDSDICTAEESTRLREELRELGPAVFCQRTVDADRYTAKKLLTAFGIRPPPFLEGQPDEAYFGILSLAITRELSRRAKLANFNTVDDAVSLIKSSSNIILLTGAGISTSLGIPDFRSKGTGLYSKLEHLGLSDPQEVFDIEVFKQDPTIFYSVAKDIIPATDRYTPTHKFISMLHQRNKLLTNYSQNIDNLEIKAGVPSDKLIQCHGSFGAATCVKCGYQTRGENLFPDIKAGKIPRCERCIVKLKWDGTSAKRKRSVDVEKKKNKRRRRSDDDSSDDSDYDIPSVGVMKPNITFFGEALPDDFSKRLTENDHDKVDLVIVIGTSLKVSPVSEIVSYLPSHVPQIYVSRQAVSHVNFDIDLLGDCDVVIAELCRRLDWPLRHEMVPKDQVVDVRAVEGYKSRHTFEVANPIKSPPEGE